MTVKTGRGILARDTLPLGFGCGGLLIKLTRNESLRLVETAMDCGITYFDTARMYGFGGAEGILGKLTPRYRDRMILASKAGILPPNRTILRRLASRGVRILHKTIPKLKDHVSAPEVWQSRFGCFKISDIQKSVETSLKELTTDYLDVLLLHECTATDAQNPEVLDLLLGLKTQGKIREFGLATGIEETLQILESSPSVTSVVQFANSAWETNISLLPSRPEGLTITHSSLTGRFHALVAQLSSDPSLAKKWKAATNIDSCDSTALAQLFVAYALRSNPDGIVLFFSSKPANIRANAKIVKEPVIQSYQIDGLVAFLRATIDPHQK